jgi:hypothetical protein
MMQSSENRHTDNLSGPSQTIIRVIGVWTSSTLRVVEPRPLSVDSLEDSNLLRQILNHCLLFTVYPTGQAQKDESRRVHQTMKAGPAVLRHHNSQNTSRQNSFSPNQTRTIRVFLHYGVGVVLTTDSTDGHRSDAFSVWFRSHLCPSVESVVKTGLSFDINVSPTYPSRGAIIP